MALTKYLKTLLCTLLCLLLSINLLSSPSFAASDDATAAAEKLYELGLFQGKGTDANGNPIYALDDVPTRHEAVTMLVRLLGKEADAKAGNWITPFTDVDEWAIPYVGYAYANGLTSGTGDGTTFSGRDPITASQYLTFVLRALGYTSGTDFRWDAAWELTDRLGLTEGQYSATTEVFLRSDIAIISNNALNISLKNSNTPLIDTLNLTERITYNINFSSLSGSAVITDKYNIIVRETGKEYVDASFTYKASKYTNMANSYTLDDFFYSEFPQYKNHLINEINNGLIHCLEYNGNVYISDVNATQFFRQYNVDSYRNYKLYQYIPQEIEVPVPEVEKNPVEYEVSFSSPSESSVIHACYDIYSKNTEKTYLNGEIEIKFSAYTNMITGYFLDEFFFNEFPDYEYEIKKAVNNREISGMKMDGNIYLDAVNMVQFFRQYSIDFYKGSQNYSYTKH